MPIISALRKTATGRGKFQDPVSTKTQKPTKSNLVTNIKITSRYGRESEKICKLKQ